MKLRRIFSFGSSIIGSFLVNDNPAVRKFKEGRSVTLRSGFGLVVPDGKGKGCSGRSEQEGKNLEWFPYPYDFSMPPVTLSIPLAGRLLGYALMVLRQPDAVLLMKPTSRWRKVYFRFDMSKA